MIMTVQIYQPLPPNINASYGRFAFYKLGVCCWQYNGFDGEVEFINTLNFQTTPKMPNPTLFRIWLQPGVSAYVSPVLQITGAPPDVLINNVKFNAVTGKNMPIKLPF